MATTTSSSSPGSSSSIASEFESSVHGAEAPKFPQTADGANSIFPSMLQYAATLASLAQQMNFLQHPGMAQTLPLLYPHLYQSLLTFPNIDSIRKIVQSAPATPESKLNSSEIPSEKKALTTTNVSRKRSRKEDPQKFNGKSPTPKKHRAIRRLKFDEEKSSPVSGMNFFYQHFQHQKMNVLKKKQKFCKK